MNSLVPGTEQSCFELAAELVPAAEQELAAYAGAVRELFGSEQARQSVEDWMAEFESVEWPIDGRMPDWRRITIAAASRLAIRAQQLRFRNAVEFTTLIYQV
jgi:hypothetical protein